MLLSILFPPIPGKMGSKLWDWTFADMQDMLPDNMALLWQLDDFKSDKAASKVKLNQDPSLLALLIYSIYGSVDGSVDL